MRDGRRTPGSRLARETAAASLPPEAELLSLRQAAKMTSLSVRTLRRYIVGAVEPRLAAFQIAGGKFLVRRDELFAWLQHFRYQGGRLEVLVARIRERQRPQRA